MKVNRAIVEMVTFGHLLNFLFLEFSRLKSLIFMLNLCNFNDVFRIY